MKKVLIEAQFPDLKGDCYASSRGTGTSVKVAISRAVGALLKDKKVRKKRIHSITMRVFINEVTATESTNDANQTPKENS